MSDEQRLYEEYRRSIGNNASPARSELHGRRALTRGAGRSREFLPPWRLTNWLLRAGELAAFVLIVGILVVSLPGLLPGIAPRSGSSPGSNNQALTQAMVSPLLSGADALHIKATRKLLSEQGQVVETMPIEFWHKPGGNARYEESNFTGTERNILIRNGDTSSQIDPVQNYVYNETVDVSGSASMRTAVMSMFEYKTLLDAGELVCIGEEVVNGKLAQVLTDPRAGELPTPFRAYIDKANGLTLKVTGIDFETTSDSAVPNGSIVVEYPVIEYVDTGQLSADLFTIPAAPMPSTNEGPVQSTPYPAGTP